MDLSVQKLLYPRHHELGENLNCLHIAARVFRLYAMLG